MFERLFTVAKPLKQLAKKYKLCYRGHLVMQVLIGLTNKSFEIDARAAKLTVK